MKKNKMKKRVTSVICTIALMASSIGTYGFVPEKVSAEETDVEILYQGTSGKIDWSIDETGCLRITGQGISYDADWSSYDEYITSAVVEVSDITSTAQMFYGLSNLKTVDLSKSDLSDVDSTMLMFAECTSLETIDFGDWDLSNVEFADAMFAGCTSLKNFDVSNWNVSKVRFMNEMFENCTSLTEMDLSNWDVRSVEMAGGMFSGCSDLKKLNLSNWNAQFITNISYMFADCTKLEELILEGWEIPLYVDDTDILRNCNSLSEDFVYPKFDGASGVSGDLSWTIDAEGHLTITGNGDYELEYLELDNRFDLHVYMPEWCMYWGSIMSAKVDVTNITSAEKMFSYCPLLESVEFVDFDSSKLTNMSSMFEMCRSLVEVDMSGWDVSNVTDISNMFYYCDSLLTINMQDTYFSINVNDNNATSGCSSLDSSFIIPKKANILFQGRNGALDWSIDEAGCLRISGNGSYYSYSSQWWDYSEYITTAVVEVSGILSMNSMFKDLYNLVSVDMSKSDFSQVEKTTCMFENCESLETVEFGNCDMSNVKFMHFMFNGCTNLQNFDVSNWDVNNVRYMLHMFADCQSLTEMDMSNWNVSALEDATAMFANCYNLESLNLSNWYAPYAYSIGYMFSNCSMLSDLNLDGWKISLAADDEGIFEGCDSLDENFEYLKFTGASGTSGDLEWSIDKTGHLTISGEGDYELEYLEIASRDDISAYMPEWCLYWSGITGATVDVTNITSTERMFFLCGYIESVYFKNFDTSNVITMSPLFNDCYSLKSVDMSGWDFSKVTSAENIFCSDDTFVELYAPTNTNISIELPNGNWYDINRNVYTELPKNTEQSLKLVREDQIVNIAENFKLEINGFQIRNDATGIRTLYSVNDPKNQVVKVGLIYGLCDYSDASDMIVNSSNNLVYNFAATEIGKMNNTVSEYADATTYVMTMMFGEVDSSFYEASTMVRAYALLEDGTYVYSDVVEYSIFDVADEIYTNSKMGNLNAHTSLYTNILKIVNPKYLPVDFKNGFVS